ncbi:MAG: YhgE/Pip domain-containing protein, partial [Eubacteriales bacterium]
MKKKHLLFKRISLLVGVLLIPTIYSLCYLQAYWDPYNSLDKLPVAVVNQDKGAEVDGKQANLGKDLVDELKKSDTLKCSFVTIDQADSGVAGNQYYAAIVIPDNFSENISSASQSNKQTATILYEPNQEHNYVASLLLKSAVNTIVTGLKGQVNESITSNLSLKLQEVPSKLQSLKDGLDQLDSGANELQTGIRKVTGGQESLQDGAESLNSGLIDLSKGAGELNSGVSTLDSSLSEALSGAQQLNNGAANLTTLNAGITSASQGASGLSAGLAQLQAQFGTNASNPTLKDNINALNSGAKSVAGQFAGGSTSNVKHVVSSLASEGGAPSYVDNVNTLVSVLRKDSGTYNSLLAGLASASDESSKKSYAAALVLLTDTGNATEVAQTSGALGITGDAITSQQNTLSGGGDSIKQGVALLSAQFTAASSGQSPTLFDGVQQLAAGTGQLAGQMKTSGDADKPSLYDSVSMLNTGAAKLAAGTEQLSAGESN